MKFSKWLTDTLCELIDEEYIEANQPVYSDNIAINMANAAKGQLTGTFSSAIQKVNQFIGTSLPHENQSLKNLKHESADKLMKDLRKIANSKNTTLQDCDALLTRVEEELCVMRKKREEHNNTDPGIYDSLLVVCKRAIQHTAKTNKSYIDAFEEAMAGDDQSPKALLYDLLRFFLKKYFIVRIDYLKNYTPKVNELTKIYGHMQTEILQSVLLDHLDALLYFLKQFNEASINNSSKEKIQGNIYYGSIRDMLTQTKKAINKRIKQESVGIKDLYKEFDLFDLKISRAIEGTKESIPIVIKDDDVEKEVNLKEEDELKSLTEIAHLQHIPKSNEGAHSRVNSDEDLDELAESFLESDLGKGTHSRSDSFSQSLRHSLQNIMDEIEVGDLPSGQDLSIASRPVIVNADLKSLREMDSRQLAWQQKSNNGELLLSSGANVTAALNVVAAANGHAPIVEVFQNINATQLQGSGRDPMRTNQLQQQEKKKKKKGKK